MQQNAVLSWRSEMSSHSVNKRDPGLIDSAPNRVVLLARAISGISSRMEEKRGMWGSVYQGLNGVGQSRKEVYVGDTGRYDCGRERGHRRIHQGTS